MEQKQAYSFLTASGKAVSPGDEARRMVSHHFQKIAALKRSSLLDEAILRSVATREQVALFCKVIEPMEAAVNAGYDRTSFDELAALYGGRQYLLSVPVRDGEAA